MQSEIDPWFAKCLSKSAFLRNSHRTALTCWAAVQKLISRRVFSLSASLFVQTWHEKNREPVNIGLQNDENPAGNSLYFTSCNTFPTSYSCMQRVCAGFVLYSVLTRWDVGVQSCPGGGWWVLEGCGSFWHLHSWAGRIASPDWNLSANGIHWHPQK